MKAHLKKTISGLKPADEETAKYFEKGKLGDIYHFDIKRVKDARNWRHLQKYWVLLQLVIDNQERYRTKEELHEALKFELGITETRQTMTGELYKVVGSVAMNKMTQDQFDAYYQTAITLILRYILTGTTPEELESAVMEVLSFS